MSTHSIEVRLRVERTQAQKGTTEDIIIIQEGFDATCSLEEDARVAVDAVITNYIVIHNLDKEKVTVDKIDVMPMDERG